MALILKQYKVQGGGINYPAIFCIPSTERIPVLAAEDFTRINMLVIGALTMAFESLNLKRGLNEMQILDLSECIIDSASDDNLSFEDLLLFLQNMVRGKYEMSYESMDIPKFMRMFGIYREERHRSMLEYRENQHLHHKGLGDASRTSQPNPLEEHFSNIQGRISEMKEALSEKKQQETMRKAEKYFKNE